MLMHLFRWASWWHLTKIYGKVLCGYEPVSTKSFYHGHTEGMRSATSECGQLCEIMCGESSSSQQKLAALRRATEVHEQYVRECTRGKGLDQHLFALNVLLNIIICWRLISSSQNRGDSWIILFCQPWIAGIKRFGCLALVHSLLTALESVISPRIIPFNLPSWEKAANKKICLGIRRNAEGDGLAT